MTPAPKTGPNPRSHEEKSGLDVDTGTAGAPVPPWVAALVLGFIVALVLIAWWFL